MKDYFTTNEIAKICRVTRQTVINWIKSGRLQAQITPGRHRRIMREALITFLENAGLDLSIVEDYEEEVQKRLPYCWEYYAIGFSGRNSSHRCEGCLVKRVKALHCYLLADKIDIADEFCQTSCEECRYYHRYIRT